MPNVLYCADVAGEGGALRHRAAVVRGLTTLGWDVDAAEGVVAPLRRMRSRAGAAGSPAATHRLRQSLLRSAASIALAGNTAATLVSLLRRTSRVRPDVVLWRPGYLQVHGFAIARRLGVPLVLEVNAPIAAEAGRFRAYPFSGLAAAVERYALHEADRIIAVSAQAVAEEVQPAVEVIPNGGGYLDVTEAEEAHRWGERWCPICTDPASGDHRHAVLLESFRDWHGTRERQVAVQALPQGWNALVLGSGPTHASFVRWVRERGLTDRVRTLGHTRPEGVQHLLAEHADLGFVLYPPMERFWFSPLKLYDFLAHGVPIVATDIGQVGCVGRDVSHPEIRLVDPGDLAALAVQVRDVCEGLAPRERRDPAQVLTSVHGWPTTIASYARVLTGSLD